MAKSNKGDFLSPKAVANRQKMKGLQKLKFYCQLCEKQCRDQNGFKQHCSSEAHLRQVAVFGENSGRFIKGYSEQFLANFLDMMAVSHRNTRIKATVAYNEYIGNKTHVHMNSTKWTTLTEFVKYLGREKLCDIEETAKGWFITYKPRDKEEQLRDRMEMEKRRKEEDEETRMANVLARQIAKQNKKGGEEKKEERKADAIDLDDGEREKINLHVVSGGLNNALENSEKKRKDIVDFSNVGGMFSSKKMKTGGKEEGKAAFKKRKKLKWMLRENIVCRKTETGEKGTVVRVNVEDREADVKLKESGSVVENVDEDEFEPVCPGVGGKCAVVRNHDFVGEEGKVLGVDGNTGEVTIESFKRGIQFKAKSSDVARLV